MIFWTLFINRFPSKIVKIRAKIRVKAGSKIKVNLKAKLKSGIWVESILLSSLFNLLENTNLNYINFGYTEPNIKL